MSRRTCQNTIVWIVTVLFVGTGLYLGPIEKDFRMFFGACVIYALFLAVFTAVSRLGVPAEMRKRPEIPDDFHAIQIGPASARLLELLPGTTTLGTRVHKEIVHQLHEITRTFPNGEWICRFEIGDNHVLARSITFKSKFSPALDFGDTQGSGIFMTTGMD